jgi:hypothetical protein
MLQVVLFVYNFECKMLNKCAKWIKCFWVDNSKICSNLGNYHTLCCSKKGIFLKLGALGSNSLQ